ncbi:MAG: hypothetical protein ED859_14795 [Desulfuromonadales bacterium]|nr:MAG: hypothetical protein ED859_14795 [Desulfuromonadales bacterium]
MRTRIAASAVATVLGSVSSAFAASGAREDNSGVFAWIFLGFCALIIVAQLIPSVLTTIGMAKGVADSVGRKEAVKHS